MATTLGKLYVVATPIGNLNDLSLRTQQVLSKVTWVAAEDTRHSKGLLQHLGVAPQLISYHEHNEDARAEQLVAKLLQGEEGALISDAGTPLISDPGYLLVAKAHQANIQVVPIPGPCAPIAALSASGLPTDKFLFEGFLPAKKEGRRKRLLELKNFPHTLVFFEAPHRIKELLRDLTETFGAERVATYARELTKKFEAIRLSKLGSILDDLEKEIIPAKGEFIIMVAGASPTIHEPALQEKERILKILLEELPVKAAVKVAVALTGLPKNTLYETALSLKNESE